MLPLWAQINLPLSHHGTSSLAFCFFLILSRSLTRSLLSAERALRLRDVFLCAPGHIFTVQMHQRRSSNYGSTSRFHNIQPHKIRDVTESCLWGSGRAELNEMLNTPVRLKENWVIASHLVGCKRERSFLSSFLKHSRRPSKPQENMKRSTPMTP